MVMVHDTYFVDIPEVIGILVAFGDGILLPMITLHPIHLPHSVISITRNVITSDYGADDGI